MKVVIDMEIETEDYSGKEFKEEIEKLIRGIDSDARLIRFKMREKTGLTNTKKDINWEFWMDEEG